MRAYTHRGGAHRQRVSTTGCLGKTLTNFCCAPDGILTSDHGIHWITRPRTQIKLMARTQICVHVKDPISICGKKCGPHIRWYAHTKRLHTVSSGWEARLCRSWLSSWKVTRLCRWEISIGTIKYTHQKK